MADLDHSAQTDQAFFVNFISTKQFGVVTEIAQEPGELETTDLERRLADLEKLAAKTDAAVDALSEESVPGAKASRGRAM